MNKLSIVPRLAKAVLLGTVNECGPWIIALCAAYSLDSPFAWSNGKAKKAQPTSSKEGSDTATDKLSRRANHAILLLGHVYAYEKAVDKTAYCAKSRLNEKVMQKCLL